jgi:uncharacterized membrane protein HdeD (DUF308 family)
MKKALFNGAIVAAILCIILGIYYLIPGIYHFVGYSNHRVVTMTAHKLYSGAFFVLAVIGGVIAFFTRPKQVRQA